MARLVLLFVRGDELKLYSRGIVVERCRIRLTPSRDSISLRESISFIHVHNDTRAWTCISTEYLKWTNKGRDYYRTAEV